MIGHDQRVLRAEIAQDARHFIVDPRQAFESVIADLAMQGAAALIVDDEAFFERADDRTRCGMDMQHTVDVGPCLQDAAMKIESRRRQLHARMARDPALVIRRRQRRSRDLVPAQAKRIYQERVCPRQSQGDVIERVVIPAEMMRDAKRRRELDALRLLGLSTARGNALPPICASASLLMMSVLPALLWDSLARERARSQRENSSLQNNPANRSSRLAPSWVHARRARERVVSEAIQLLIQTGLLRCARNDGVADTECLTPPVTLSVLWRLLRVPFFRRRVN